MHPIKTSFLLTIFALFCALTLGAQTGSYPTKDKNLPCLDKQFSVFVHVIQDSLDATGVTEADIATTLEGVNDIFAPICVSFAMCDFAVYPTYQFDTLATEQLYEEFQKRHYVREVINLFLVTEQSIVDDEPCGFSTQLGINHPDSGSIVSLKPCLNSLNLSHHLGHFFGLLNTYEGNGAELVSGANCETEGDEICDTPADPYDPEVTKPWLGQGKEACLFIANDTDANGEFYRPDVGNIMSAYEDCYCGFTRLQFVRMAEHIQNAPRAKW